MGDGTGGTARQYGTERGPGVSDVDRSPLSGDGQTLEPGTGADETVRQAIVGDEESLRRLWNQHRRWVAAVLLAHMPRDAELDDLLQEVGMAVVGKIDGLRDEAAFKPWLRAVAISVAKTTARRQKVRRAGWLKLVGFSGRRADDDEFGEASAGTSSLAEGRRLMELCGELPDGYREPLLLKCVQGMSYKQIGEVMNLPDTTIETRIARARRMLRERAVKAGLGPENESDAAGPGDRGVDGTRIES